MLLCVTFFSFFLFLGGRWGLGDERMDGWDVCLYASMLVFFVFLLFFIILYDWMYVHANLAYCNYFQQIHSLLTMFYYSSPVTSPSEPDGQMARDSFNLDSEESLAKAFTDEMLAWYDGHDTKSPTLV